MDQNDSAVEKIQVCSEGDASLPALIYLPGLHGDWTLTWNLSRCLRGRVRFVRITYPRALSWSLDDYAAAVEGVLGKLGIREGWLLGESFASQITWTIVGRANFNVRGIILAGGFVRHPMPWLVRPVGIFCNQPFMRAFLPVYLAYVKYFRRRKSDGPEMREAMAEFVSRRTERDLQAIRHRLRLIAENDPRPIAQQNKIPVYGLTGWLDPVVPWPLVRRWLRRNCPALQDYQVVARSDHNVLQMAAPASARWILKWMGEQPAVH